MLRTALIFSVLFVAYDALAAALARWIVISYDSFVVPPVIAAFFMGVYAGRKKRSWGGLAPVALAAVVEVTVGWYVAALIGPGYVPGWTLRELIVLATESAALIIAVGAAGVWVGLGVSGVRRGFL